MDYVVLFMVYLYTMLTVINDKRSKTDLENLSGFCFGIYYLVEHSVCIVSIYVPTSLPTAIRQIDNYNKSCNRFVDFGDVFKNFFRYSPNTRRCDF